MSHKKGWILLTIVLISHSGEENRLLDQVLVTGAKLHWELDAQRSEEPLRVAENSFRIGGYTRDPGEA